MVEFLQPNQTSGAGGGNRILLGQRFLIGSPQRPGAPGSNFEAEVLPRVQHRRRDGQRPHFLPAGKQVPADEAAARRRPFVGDEPRALRPAPRDPLQIISGIEGDRADHRSRTDAAICRIDADFQLRTLPLLQLIANGEVNRTRLPAQPAQFRGIAGEIEDILSGIGDRDGRPGMQHGG